MKEIIMEKLLIPDAIVGEVLHHRMAMINANADSDIFEFMLSADFSVWFSDYLLKYGYRLLERK